MPGGRRRVTSREIDRFGLVDCAHRHDPPTLDECALCADLVGADTDDEGRVLRVRCRTRDDAAAVVRRDRSGGRED